VVENQQNQQEEKQTIRMQISEKKNIIQLLRLQDASLLKEKSLRIQLSMKLNLLSIQEIMQSVKELLQRDYYLNKENFSLQQNLIISK